MENSQKRRLTKDEVLSISQDKIDRATEAELRQYVRVLADVANKRIKRLEATNLSDVSPAYIAVRDGGKRGIGKFSTAGKDRNKLLAEFVRVRGFLAGETSTVTGTRALRKRTEKRLGIETLTPDTEKQMWKLYSDLEKANLPLVKQIGSTQVQKLVLNTVQQNENKTRPEQIKDLENELELLYIERESSNNDLGNNSGEFMP